MKKIDFKPSGFECSLDECPPGFFLFRDEICLKTEYGPCEAFCSSGEAFWGGVELKEEVAKLKVIPLEYEIEET